MNLLELPNDCRTAEDVRERRKRHNEWRQREIARGIEAERKLEAQRKREAEWRRLATVKAKERPTIGHVSLPSAEDYIPNFMKYKQTRMAEFDFIEPPKVGIKDIMIATAEYFKISTAALMSDHRSQHIAYPRQVAFFLCRKLTSFSFPEIGRRFVKDHTTVLHGVGKIQTKLLQGDTKTEAAVAEITRRVTA